MNETNDAGPASVSYVNRTQKRLILAAMKRAKKKAARAKFAAKAAA